MSDVSPRREIDFSFSAAFGTHYTRRNSETAVVSF